ncbi:MAG: hypothetical protein PVG30_02025 [Gammaproteobacteria bacterium]|jgi:hypothetical protein
MNELKLTNNVTIGLKNGKHLGRRLSDCIMVDYVEVNSTNYYIESKSDRLSFKELIRDYIVWDLRQDLDNSLDKPLLTDSTLKVFINRFEWILSKYKIDINNYDFKNGGYGQYDMLFNELFVAYKNSLMLKFDYDFENIFDNKINCYQNYNEFSTHFSFELENLKIVNNHFLHDSDWFNIKNILEVLNYMQYGKDNYDEMIQEYLLLLQFLSDKKFVKIGQTDIKQSTTGLMNLLSTMKYNHTKVIRHGRKNVSIYFRDELLELKYS